MANDQNRLPRQTATASIIARVSQSTELHRDRNGQPFCRFDVAVNRGGQPHYFTLHAFKETAVEISESVGKGDLVEFHTNRFQQFNSAGKPIMAIADPYDADSDEDGYLGKTHIEIVEGFQIIARNQRNLQSEPETTATTNLGDVLAAALSEEG